jgi:hypothetical protein
LVVFALRIFLCVFGLFFLLFHVSYVASVSGLPLL